MAKKNRKPVNRKKVRKKNNHYKRFERNTTPMMFWFDWREALEEGGIDEEGRLPLRSCADHAIGLDHTLKTPGGGKPLTENVLSLNRKWLIQLEMDTYNTFREEYESIPRYLVTPVCSLDDVAQIYKAEKAKMIAGYNPKYVQGVSWGVRALTEQNKRFLKTVEEKYIKYVKDEELVISVSA